MTKEKDFMPDAENNNFQATQNLKVLLIDLENCPSQIRQLQEDLSTFHQVVICYANHAPKIPLDWLLALSAAINNNKLKIVKMENGGKNSADFGICFFAGMLMQSLPRETHFVIVSNDTDLDHAVRLLISQERTAERVGKKKEDTQAGTHESNESLSAYCAHLISYSKNRPAKEATLVNSIKSKFNKTPSIATDVLNLLLNQSVIKIENGKVIYNEQKIIRLANTNH
jgi:hypothetical protein